MTGYTVEFDPRTQRELRALPRSIRITIFEQLEFLSAAPFRSHPGVLVKPVRSVHGVWHFHASHDVRVYYATVGSVVRVVLVIRAPGVDRKAVRELRRRHPA